MVWAAVQILLQSILSCGARPQVLGLYLAPQVTWPHLQGSTFAWGQAVWGHTLTTLRMA